MPRPERVAHVAPLAFDGERFLPDGATVLVEGPSILAVHPGMSVIPEGFAVQRHDGGTLLPGLIDTHVHLIADGQDGALGRDPRRTADEREQVVRESLQGHVRAGVTTVRDLGDNRWNVLQRETRSHEPTVVASGPPVTTPGGHCAALGGEAAGADALVAAVDERAERGAPLVKIVVSGGAMTPGSDLLSLQYSPDDLALVVKRAERHGLPVVAHAHSLDAVNLCIDSGVRGIEHCTCLTTHGVQTPPDLAERLRRHGIHIGPTFGRIPGSRPSAQAQEVTRRTGLVPAHRFAQVEKLHREGVLVISGSDAGIHAAKPHGIVALAVAELVAAGIAPDDAIATATGVSAQACGLANKGRLGAGADADLLVVDGDPRLDITALTRVRTVVVRGDTVRDSSFRDDAARSPS
ncbi:amidohydrolase family protein [Kineosporia succinea]|uniref:Imidazolonepropionase-like amidohydrolase n=1 Tax=Kineosporia succinea TaxID=84632 RepID=A0ABT9P7J6_9ACTN|nr:amidohydrolase family protein [Kineosporia succinea]MDP9828673.1 imidazolonepropionase-like amidohydrolase [Kineosporia succinea]